jgi:hypothetical protein
VSAPESPDLIAALEARIAALGAEIAELEGHLGPKVAERERCEAALRALTGSQQRVTPDTMHLALRKKYSESTAKRRPPDPRMKRFLAACNRSKHVSMRTVAELIGVNPGYLSQMLRGKHAPLELARKVAKLIDYPATPENWPNLGE